MYGKWGGGTFRRNGEQSGAAVLLLWESRIPLSSPHYTLCSEEDACLTCFVTFDMFLLVFKVALWDSNDFNCERTDIVTDYYLGKVSDLIFQKLEAKPVNEITYHFVLKPDSGVDSANLHKIDLIFKFAFVILFCRITKPLTFADCVGDELPLGWETVYDKQIGIYYMDHINSK